MTISTNKDNSGGISTVKAFKPNALLFFMKICTDPLSLSVCGVTEEILAASAVSRISNGTGTSTISG